MAYPSTKLIFDTELSLMQITVDKLRARKLDLVAINKETDLPYHWLSKLAAGEFQNPSVNRIQFLYEYLTGNKLLQE